MKISYNWLKNYINTDIDYKELSVILTNTGLEVEGIEHFESVKGGLEGLVIGKVVESSKHPDADRLTLTKVDIGTGELLPIVCGAPNVDTGQKVVVATVGTTLYDDDSEFKINIRLSYNTSEKKINYMSTTIKMQPADIYMAFEISKITHKHIDDVIVVYKNNKSKGWGYMAKCIGVIPK